MWGLPVGAPIALAPRPAAPPQALAPLEAWVAEARARRLELAEAATAIRREVHAANLAEALRFGEGELDLQGGTIGRDDSPLAYGAFALPVPLWRDPVTGAAAARADAARLEAERAALGRAIELEVADAYLGCRQAAERLRTCDEVLVPLAGHGLERALLRVRAGAATGVEVLEARKQQLDAQNAELEARLDYDLAVLRLVQAAGR
jgi:outer membrane protein TolC